MGVIGYKVFNPDWTCSGFQYEVGKTYILDGDLQICVRGFHFCKKLSDCFDYDKFDPENKVAVIEASGTIAESDGICATDVITILKEMSWYEVLDLVNTSKACTGYRNRGFSNSGNYNRGDLNSGDFNSGLSNSGNKNSGDYNSGFYNSGYRNSGDCNSGDWNSGDFNSTDYSSGYFNTEEAPLFVFNKPTSMTHSEFQKLPGYRVLRRNFHLSEWVVESRMTRKEKQEHPEYVAMGGYLKSYDYKTAFRNMWNKFTDMQKQMVTALPNFDAEIFKEITGIDVNNG